MKAPLTQEEIDYRADLSNKINAISSLQGLFTDIEDKPRRLRILKTLLASLDYGDEIYTEIDAEIAAIEEALENEETTEGEEAIGAETPADSAPGEDSGEDIDLGSLSALEDWKPGESTIILTEDRELEDENLNLLFEDDLPSPAELSADKDFSENN